MLIQVYKCGASRQRITKGFNINSTDVETSKILVEKIVREFHDPNIKIIYDIKKSPNTIWFDTGMIWFHNVKARETHLSHLNRAIDRVSQMVRANRGVLFPNAVRLNNKEDWQNYVCGDIHFLETLSDFEKEVFCNLCREYEPLLIALSGRAGVDADGIENIGSRRLLDSQTHFATRYLASLHPIHLEKVKKVLSRDDGVTKLEVLGINPLGDITDKNIDSVEIRFIDGQALLSSVRAQAILYQAILLRARRWVKEGKRKENPLPQWLIEKNRAKTIANGLNTSLELNKKNKHRGRFRDDKRSFAPANKILIKMLESFVREFQILEVEYHEIAPLLLGVSLKKLGLAGICNENDLFKVVSRKNDWKGKHWVNIVQSFYTNNAGQEKAYQVDKMTRLNEERFPKQAELTKRWWLMKLKYRPKPTKKPNGQSSHNREQVSKKSRAPRLSPEELEKQLRAGTIELLNQLREVNTPANTSIHLNTFYQKTKNNALSYVLRQLDRNDSKLLRKRLLPKTDFRFRLEEREKGWESSSVKQGQIVLADSSTSMLYFTVEQEEEKRIRTWMNKFIRTAPRSVLVFILGYRRFIDKKSSKKLLTIEILLCNKIV